MPTSFRPTLLLENTKFTCRSEAIQTDTIEIAKLVFLGCFAPTRDYRKPGCTLAKPGLNKRPPKMNALVFIFPEAKRSGTQPHAGVPRSRGNLDVGAKLLQLTQ